MLLNLGEQISKEWHKLLYWFEMNYSNPWLWIGIVVAVILFMLLCFSYLDKGK